MRHYGPYPLCHHLFVGSFMVGPVQDDTGDNSDNFGHISSVSMPLPLEGPLQVFIPCSNSIAPSQTFVHNYPAVAEIAFVERRGVSCMPFPVLEMCTTQNDTIKRD